MRVELDGNERIYRYEVPVDDKWHAFELQGDPLAVYSRTFGVVEFWARWTPNANGLRREFRAVGTGQPMPSQVRYHGTAVAGPLVWHLVERCD